VLHWPLAFPQVFARGGFDVILGNPPWGGDLPGATWTSGMFVGAAKQPDTAFLFLELALRVAKSHGFVALVLPDSLLLNQDLYDTRSLILERTALTEVVKIAQGIFEGVVRGCALLTLQKRLPDDDHHFRALLLTQSHLRSTGAGTLDIAAHLRDRGAVIGQRRLLGSPGRTISVNVASEDEQLLAKICAAGLDWDSLVERGRGIELNSEGIIVQCPSCGRWGPPPKQQKGAYSPKTCAACGNTFEMSENPKTARIISVETPADGETPFIDGGDFARYRISRLRTIDITRTGVDYKSPEMYSPPKILFRQVGVGITASLDMNIGAYVPQSVYLLRLKDERVGSERNYRLSYILGVLNSRLMAYYVLRETGQVDAQSFPRWTLGRVFQIPVRMIDWNNKQFHAWHDDIARSVESLEHATGDEAVRIDAVIELLVARLYGVSVEEWSRIWRTLEEVTGVGQIEHLVDPRVGDAVRLGLSNPA
jgi:hypothetical protein